MAEWQLASGETVLDPMLMAEDQLCSEAPVAAMGSATHPTALSTEARLPASGSVKTILGPARRQVLFTGRSSVVASPTDLNLHAHRAAS